MRGMMRRPVCLIGLAFVILIRIGLYFHPLSGPDLTEIDRSIVVLSGQVDRKEYHISNDQEVLVIYLKNVRVTNPQTENNKTDVTKQKQRTEDPYAAIRGVICYPEEGQEPRMGSYVRVRGKLYAFAEATNPGEFDAKRYYQILNLQAGIRNAVILHETNDYDRFREGLYALRTYLSSLLDQSLDEKNASVMKAVLLGEKGGLHEETKQLYQQNGIIHILSISGLHISIIGMGFSRLLRKGGCPKIANVILSVILMYGYGHASGFCHSDPGSLPLPPSLSIPFCTECSGYYISSPEQPLALFFSVLKKSVLLSYGRRTHGSGSGSVLRILSCGHHCF